jgi:cytochrome b6-f complex iron-sulfur subunit
MADPKQMSVEEILAACRKADSGGDGDAPAAAESTPVAEESAAPAASPERPASAAPPSGKSPNEMSVAEMLAAARAEKSGGGATPAPAKSEASAAPTAAAGGKSPKQMSVAEMLAAARGEKSASKPAGEKAAPEPAAKPKPAAADKASPKPAAKAPPSGPKDTASILAAARAGKPKPGPITKAEAAAKGEVKAKPAKEKLAVPTMPEKPAYARPEAAPAGADEEDRRTFLGSLAAITLGSSLAVGFSSLAVTHLLWALGFARFMFPNILIEPPTRFKVGFPDEYAPGQVETKFKAQFGVWIVRYEYQGTPQIYALQSVCTHLGCTPNWLEGEQKFKCPCHGSGFYKDGINFEGPAPRPLERFAIGVADDGQLEVDKSRKFLEEKGEWKDPTCKVLT